jgi:hypothetical protein
MGHFYTISLSLSLSLSVELSRLETARSGASRPCLRRGDLSLTPTVSLSPTLPLSRSPSLSRVYTQVLSLSLSLSLSLYWEVSPAAWHGRQLDLLRSVFISLDLFSGRLITYIYTFANLLFLHKLVRICRYIYGEP